MKVLRWLLVSIVAAAAAPAQARNDLLLLPISEALAAPAAREKLDPGVRLYFGTARKPAVARSIGTWSTNKKTNSVGKSDEEACRWAFLSAVMALQQRAKREGGNAVVAITSRHGNAVTDSAEKYACGAGSLMAGVSFRGEVVKLGE